jgi:hypothetical protein
MRKLIVLLDNRHFGTGRVAGAGYNSAGNVQRYRAPRGYDNDLKMHGIGVPGDVSVR